MEGVEDILSSYFGDIDVVGLREAHAASKPGPMADILIGAKKQDLLNVFYDRMHTHKEVSERMYHLSGSVILHVNSADYSAWEWRWKCFVHMSDSDERDFVYYEKEMMRSVATANPKNYQLWNHRRKLAMFQGPSCLKEECTFTAACLEFDAKNYHAWAHRQSLLRMWATSANLDAEFACTSEFLERDVMNNSAWTQRAFILKLDACTRTFDDEIAYVTSLIPRCVENEAAWAYYKHLALYNAPMQRHVEEYLTFCTECLDMYPNSIEVTSAIFDYYRLLLQQMSQRDGCQEKAQACKERMAAIRRKMVAFDPLCATRFT